MPVVGFMCQFKGPVSFDECLACAKTWEQKCDFREPIVAMIVENLRDERKGMSATMITGCLRKAYLARTTDYYVGIEEEWWRFRGQLGHSILEKYEGYENAIKEKRFGAMFVHKGKEYPISGRVDLVIPQLNLLTDWKTAAAVPRYKKPYSGHTKQLNIYRWILRENGIPIDRMEVDYMDMKQPKPLEAQIWPDEAVDRYLADNLVPLTEAFETGVAPPKPKNDDEGLWQCDGYCEEILKTKCAELARGDLLAELKATECAKCKMRHPPMIVDVKDGRITKVRPAKEKASPIAGRVIGVNTGVVGSALCSPGEDPDRDAGDK